MNLIPEDSGQDFLGQFFLFLLSFVDDALIMGLSRLGCHFSWLHWLSPVSIFCSIVYTGFQFWCHGVPKLVQMWATFQRSHNVEKTPSN